MFYMISFLIKRRFELVTNWYRVIGYYLVIGYKGTKIPLPVGSCLLISGTIFGQKSVHKTGVGIVGLSLFQISFTNDASV